MEQKTYLVETEIKELQRWDHLNDTGKALVKIAFSEGMKYPDGMSDYQIEHFVVGQKEDPIEQFPTASSKFWYCRLALRDLLGGLLNTHWTYEKLLADIDVLEGEIEEWIEKTDVNEKVRKGNIQRKKIEIQQKEFSLGVTAKSVKDQLRMMKKFEEERLKWDEKREGDSDNKELDEEAVWLVRSRGNVALQGRVPGTEKPLPFHIERLLKRDFTQ